MHFNVPWGPISYNCDLIGGASTRIGASLIVRIQCHCFSHCTQGESSARGANPHCLTAEYPGAPGRSSGTKPLAKMRQLLMLRSLVPEGGLPGPFEMI